MARMQGVPPGSGGPFVRLVYREMRRRLGQVPDQISVTAHHKKLLLGYSLVEWAVDGADSVDEELKSLAVLKAAAMMGCEFCLDIGSHLARETGVSDAQLLDLPRYADSPHFTDLQKLVLDYAVAMTRTPTEVTDELVATLRGHFDERQMVELTTLIAIENYRSRFNGAFGLGAQGFSEGAVCARPEAGSPALAGVPSTSPLDAGVAPR